MRFTIGVFLMKIKPLHTHTHNNNNNSAQYLAIFLLTCVLFLPSPQRPLKSLAYHFFLYPCYNFSPCVKYSVDLRGDGEGVGTEIIIKLGKRGSLRENLTPRPPLYHQLLQCASLVEFGNLERKRPCCGTKTKMELSAVELYGRRKKKVFLGRGRGKSMSDVSRAQFRHGFLGEWESKGRESPCLLEWDAGMESVRYDLFSEGRWNE